MAARLAICSYLERLLTHWWRRVSNVCHADPAVVIVILCPAAVGRGKRRRVRRGRGCRSSIAWKEEQPDSCRKHCSLRFPHVLLTLLLLMWWLGSKTFDDKSTKGSSPLSSHSPALHRAFCSTAHSVSSPPFRHFSPKEENALCTKAVTSTSLSLKMSFVSPETVTMSSFSA